MSKQTQLLNLGEWVVKASIPPQPKPDRVIVLLHGWKGDENSMWVFAHKFPRQALVISPRGIVAAPDSGYGWVNRPANRFSTLAEFAPAVESLDELLALRPGIPNHFIEKVILIGFSQGAALAYAFAYQYPERVALVAGLAGFVPEGIRASAGTAPLKNIPFFISHGTQDEIVPVEMARQGISVLEEAGANVSYCEDEVGHKLSAGCLKALENLLEP